MCRSSANKYFAHPLLRAQSWQYRPQLDEVCQWWRDGGRGVCALVGMGGVGKTAIAERFLRIMPDGLPKDPEIAKDCTLPALGNAFVFSFYDKPNTEAFFLDLQMWLMGTQRVKPSLSIGQMFHLLRSTSGLIVLDGLERLQEDQRQGDSERFTSPKLHEFLYQLTIGDISDLSVLITNRFQFTELSDGRNRFFRQILIDKMDSSAGIALLRQRGVKGTDEQLVPIVEQCGHHALTVDLAGGYIAEYGNNDPATPLDLGSGIEPKVADYNAVNRNVLHQGFRFAQVAKHFREAMVKRDEAAVDLLERICLVPEGASKNQLACLFCGSPVPRHSTHQLAALSTEELHRKLDLLVEQRVISEVPNSYEEGDKNVMSYHPIMAYADWTIWNIRQLTSDPTNSSTSPGFLAAPIKPSIEDAEKLALVSDKETSNNLMEKAATSFEQFFHTHAKRKASCHISKTNRSLKLKIVHFYEPSISRYWLRLELNAVIGYHSIVKIQVVSLATASGWKRPKLYHYEKCTDENLVRAAGDFLQIVMERINTELRRSNAD